MGYLIDRRQAWATDEIVAVVLERPQQGHSRLILRDNSLCQSPTRPRTLRRWVEERQGVIRGWSPHRPSAQRADRGGFAQTGSLWASRPVGGWR